MLDEALIAHTWHMVDAFWQETMFGVSVCVSYGHREADVVDCCASNGWFLGRGSPRGSSMAAGAGDQGWVCVLQRLYLRAVVGFIERPELVFASILSTTRMERSNTISVEKPETSGNGSRLGKKELAPS